MSESNVIYQTLDRTKIHTQVLKDIHKERVRQEQKWGDQKHDFGTWLMILAEEFGEVAQAMQVDMGWGKSTDAQHLYKELIQLSAVSAKIAEQVKGQEGD